LGILFLFLRLSLLINTDIFSSHKIVSHNAELQSSSPQAGREPILEREARDNLRSLLRRPQARRPLGGTETSKTPL
jgi:hypothetical protein